MTIIYKQTQLLFIHSDDSPAVSNNRWGSFHHDGDNFIIETGALTGAGSSGATITNDLILNPTGNVEIGTNLVIDGDLTVKKNATVGNLTVEGNSDVSGNTSSSWFKGLFNWIIKPDISIDYLNFNGSSPFFQ